MKKHEKRYHKTIGNKVASVYIKEVYLPKSITFSYAGSSISTSYYEYICACVSNSKRTNNDWWNDDKKACDKMWNRSTGTATTFVSIADMAVKHADAFIKEYGYYCCMIDATDNKRLDTYFKMVYHYAKKKHLTITTVATDDGLLCWFE